MRRVRWLIPALGLSCGGLLIAVALHLGQDVRIRLRTLTVLDPPAGPVVVRFRDHALSVKGAFLQTGESDRIVLRAWAPTVAVEVVAAGAGHVRLVVENVPRRVHLDASGPVRQHRRGTMRILTFEPATTRRLGFTDLSREVTFVTLGDTGDSQTWIEALRLAAHMDADFFLHLGDLIYEDVQMSHIAGILAASPLPVYMVRGNHDYRNQARIEFMRALGPPYYLFGMGSATFIVLDNAGNYLPGLWRRSTQYRWFTGMLGIPRVGPLFVAAHKPLFDRRPGGTAYLDDGAFAQALMRDFARAGVAAMFAGHAHASHLWVEDRIPYVVNGEGFYSPRGLRQQQVAWVRVRGWDVAIHQVPIWGGR
jgi:predicted phosphodiesterase